MRLLTSLLAAALLFFGATAQAAVPLKVVTSFSILGDMAQTIGGDAVAVRSLAGPDVDAHEYQPTPDDAKILAGADLVIINGLGFEGWMTRLIEASGYKGPVIVASQGIKPRQLEIRSTMDTPKEVTDPHAWQNLAFGRVYAQNINMALQQAIGIPAQKINLQSRWGDYDAAMAKMDQYVRSEFAAIPPEHRKVITSHDAFGYFGEAYGITFASPEGVSTDAEPSAEDIAKLVQQIKSTGVKQVFMENMTSGKLIAQISKDAGATMGGTLYSDALSGPTGAAPTYLDMFHNNVPKLKAAMMAMK